MREYKKCEDIGSELFNVRRYGIVLLNLFSLAVPLEQSG